MSVISMINEEKKCEDSVEDGEKKDSERFE